MEVVMGKRSRPVIIAAVADEPDFPEVGQFGYSLELPTADEFVCSGDEVREECAMLGGAYESSMDWASA
jgi:hypothetical protein